MRNSWRLAASGLILASSPLSAAWEFKAIEDPMTDAQRGISTLMGDGGVLVVKCDRNGPGTLYISFVTRHYLGGIRGNKNRDIKVRFDGGDVSPLQAYHDGGSASIFGTKPSEAGGRFLAQLIASQKLAVQVTSYDYDSYTIVFDTAGAKEAVAKSAVACRDTNWSG